MEITFKNKRILDEVVSLKIKNAINEELSINAEVDRLTVFLYGKITENLNNITFSKLSGNVSKGTLIFKNVELFDTTYTIEVECYNTNDKNSYEKMCETYNCYDAQTDFSNRIITISIGILSGTKYEDFEALLQHELEHVFQYCKIGDKLNTSFGNGLYKKAMRVISNKENYSKYQYYVAFLTYYLSDNEIDAFINQLYKDLMKTGNRFNEEEIIANSTVMKYYKTAKKMASTYNENSLFWDTALFSFGIKTDNGIKKFFTRCNKSLDRAITKIGKVVVKARKDKAETTTTAIQFNKLETDFDKKK